MRKLILPAVVIVLVLNGCRTTTRDTAPDIAPKLDEAYQSFNRGNYTAAIVSCIDLAREDPLTPGLPDLQRAIMQKLTEQRMAAHRARKALSRERAQEDIASLSGIPDTYRLRQHVKGETGSVRTPKSKMQTLLQTPISVHLVDVGLDDFIVEIGRSQNINILADGNLSDKTMTIHADETPLLEILKYVERNLGVSCSVGDNMIWVTAGSNSAPTMPLETRVYRLRKGLSSEEIEDGNDSINIIEAIERFVPLSEGGDMLFDEKAHCLLIRETKNNLEQCERIIDALDVTPPQVLIEARFLVTRVGTLRELGVDWVMNSDYTLETQRGDPKIIIPGAPVSAGGLPGATLGTAGKTVANGLTASIQGILTDPQFSAIIYALENDDDTKTLSVPRITVVNNKEATIRIGRDFYYYEEWDFDDKTVSGDNNNVNAIPSQVAPTGSPQKEELGYSLTVTPSVGSDGYSINLNLLPEVTDFVDWTENEYPLPASLSNTTNTFSTIEIPPLPIFEHRTVETELVVGSGETVVMGGLIDSYDVKSIVGVPFLSKIPFLGNLFKYEKIDREQNNLMLFVTATVIAQTGESLVPLEVPAPGDGRSSARGSKRPTEQASTEPPMPEPPTETETETVATPGPATEPAPVERADPFDNPFDAPPAEQE